MKSSAIKCIARSNPYFQEYRLWQFIQNLRLYDSTQMDKDVTSSYLLDMESYSRLFDYLNTLKEISQDCILKFLGIKKLKGKDREYPVRWNYVQDKKYPGNETRSILLTSKKKAKSDSLDLENFNLYYRLWHLLYSVEDTNEIKCALEKFADLYLADSEKADFVKVFSAIPSFKKEYGSYSEKATKKLLSVMRMGSHWSENAMDENVRISIEKVISGDLDPKIVERIGSQALNLKEISDFQGLPVWLACYVVYGRHSESEYIVKWETPREMKAFINEFRQYSMRNPIVEQCILESLRTVHDIWNEYDHIDEIHVELGRSMKSPNEARRNMTLRNLENENTNLRIKNLLLELKNEGVECVRPYSPMQLEILRIYEEGALTSLRKEDKDYNEIEKISRVAQPSRSEMVRYKLWLEQRYRSPYTGKIIPLSELFTPAYQIEHVIPQKRFFDDSMSNKVICEAAVNQEKSDMLGYEFISKCGGSMIEIGYGKTVKIFSVAEYEQFVKDNYPSGTKKKILMMDDIPEDFNKRQLNDSRYISREVLSLLSNIVREDGELESTSKNVIPCVGSITDRLKKDWGLNDVWNQIVYPRFERMNQLTGTEIFGHWDNKDGKRVFQTEMPLALQKGFSKKRIDHRHHAMDALTIACASRSIINYLNNESAKDTSKREEYRKQLCEKGRLIRKPWPTFTQDAYMALSEIVVSFKNNIRVINKATNYYEHYDESGRKVRIPQEGNSLWAIRKPMHKETIFAHVNLCRTEKVSLA